MRFTKITICRLNYEPARGPDLNEELQQLGGALGLFSQRDKDKSRFRIFIALLKALKKQHTMSSDDIADQLGLTRATVIHHLDALMDAGIVENVRGGYELRMDNMQELVELVRRDINKTLDELQEVAHNVDHELGLNAPRQPAKNRTPF